MLSLTAVDTLPACADCGQCCHLVVELAPLGDDVPEEFVVEHDGVRCMDQHGDGACVALDRATRLCTIYERPPKVCRNFLRGSATCLRGRRARPVGSRSWLRPPRRAGVDAG